MKGIVALIGICLLLIVGGLTTCGYKLYQVYDNYPEEAKFENIKSRYPDLVADLDKAIAESESALSLGTKLEQIDYPTDTLRVALHSDGDTQLVINNRLKGASSKLRITANGGGYGQMGKQAYWIFQYPLDKYEYDHIEIFFERELPPKPDSS